MPMKTSNKVKEERRMETMRLAIAAKSGNHDALNDLCEILKPLMYRVYADLSIKNVIMHEEIISLGRDGVIAAIGPFDPEKTNSFGRYCYQWMRNAMEGEARKRIHNIRLPNSVYGERRKIMKFFTELRSELGRDPTNEEVSERSELSMRTIKRVMEAPTVGSMCSLSDKVGDMSIQIHETIADESAELPSDLVEFKYKMKYITSIMDEVLNEREIAILMMLYGFDQTAPGQGDGMTLADIAKKYNLSTARIGQIVARSINQIKKVAERDGEI